jgi:hypothetical protein
VSFKKWAIFCLDRDKENCKYLQDKFYDLSIQNHLGVYVEYGDMVTIRNSANVEDFKEAVFSYYGEYVEPLLKKQKRECTPVDKKELIFFLVIMPDSIRQEYLYTALKNKINSDSPVISQFVTSKTIERDNDRIYMNLLR